MHKKIKRSILEIGDWCSFGLNCYKSNLVISLLWGILFAGFAYYLATFVSVSENTDIATPLISMIVLVMGPILALSMFGIAKRYQLRKEPSERIMNHRVSWKEFKYSAILSIFLSVLMVFYLKGTAIIYALTTLLNMAGPLVTEMTMISIPLPTEITFDYISNNLLLVAIMFIWTVVMGWMAFVISWFSFPMVMDITAHPVIAVITSLRSAWKEKFLMIMWIAFVGGAVGLAMLTPYFLGLVFITPFLAFSTWAAYEYMVVHVVELRGVEKHNYKTISH